MRRICHVQETPGDVEAVVVRLTAVDHDQLQRDPKKFVNNNKEHFFGKQVNSVVLRPPLPEAPASAPSASVGGPPTAEPWLLVVIHHPACTCVGTCTPL